MGERSGTGDKARGRGKGERNLPLFFAPSTPSFCHPAQTYPTRVQKHLPPASSLDYSILVILSCRVFDNLAAVVGKSVAQKAVLSSKRYTAEEALSIGLVDKVVPRDKVLEAAKSQMEEWTVFSDN